MRGGPGVMAITVQPQSKSFDFDIKRIDVDILTFGSLIMVRGAQERIRSAVLEWPGTQALPHRFGGTEFRLGERREIGHIHGDHLVDIPFPKRVRDEVVAAGRARPHHVLPDTGWVSFYLLQPADIEQAVQLLRQSYDLAVKQKPPGAGDAEPTETAQSQD
jgi:hypothetical protein